MTYTCQSTRGVRCPLCQFETEPNDALFYDDDKHTEECGVCGTTFTWKYFRSDLWRSVLVEPGETVEISDSKDQKGDAA